MVERHVAPRTDQRRQIGRTGTYGGRMPQLITWSSEAELTSALAHKTGLGDHFQTENVPLNGSNLESSLKHGGVAILKLGEGRYLGLVNGRILHHDLSTRRVSWEEIADSVLEGSGFGSMGSGLDRLLESCGTAHSERARARRAILCQRLHARSLGTLRVLSADPGTGFFRQWRDAGLIRTAAGFVVAHFLETLLWLGVWWAAGQAAMTGRLDAGWMLGWVLLMACLVPARVWTTCSQSRLTLGTSGLLKQRILAGALRLNPEQVASEGAGRFFSRVMEIQSLDAAALSGGLMSAVSLVEAVVAGSVLWLGAGGGLLAALFAGWAVGAVLLAWRYGRARMRWTDERLALTHDLTEKMVGHRTRLAQEAPERRHSAEDSALEEYHGISARMDRSAVLFTAVVPYGWLLTGIAGLMPAFIGGESAARLAVTLGGILLAQQALQRFTGGAAQLASAAISWRCVAPLFHAAGNMERPQRCEVPPARTVADAADVAFRYPNGSRAVLDGVSLRIERGDWVLLEGESGKGKSTLVSILAGLREPTAGLLTSGGLDRRSMGTALWRKRIAAAPQYHENHILSGTLAFNLLLGRGWPPASQDLADAEQVCRELGLGPLLERMPAGIQQMVGETGWQLSQGERSRVFLARALLQQSEMVILDESFAALDPENLRQAMECTLKRAETLLVVAHP
ncbi:MAG: ABC transporter ATP-binding protein [Terriglobia bacterium]|nr:MAG: ABC transporter ATP-binding protein [Terriglobia bacterium]